MKAFDELPLPVVTLLMQDASRDVTDLFARINAQKIAQRSVLGTWKWLFTPETAPTHIKSITIKVTLDPQGIDLKSSYTKGDKMYICYPNMYIKLKRFQEKYCGPGGKVSDEVIMENMIAYEVAFQLLLSISAGDDSLIQICSGFADYVSIKEGLLHPTHTETTEVVWYGPNTMPYFIYWIDGKYGEGVVKKLYAAFLEGPYHKSVFNNVMITGTPISTLWKMYCASIRREEREQEEFNGKLTALQPVPKLTYYLEDTLDAWFGPESPDSSDVIKIMQGEPTTAVLAMLVHFYTSKFTPNSLSITEIRFVLRSGMKDMCCIIPGKSCWEFALSVGILELPQDDKVHLVKAHVTTAFYCLWDKNENYASWPKQLGQAVAGVMGLGPSVHPIQNVEGNWDKTSLQAFDFLSWIENTTNKDTILKLHQYMMSNQYNPSWLVENTGKTLDQLWHDCKAFLEAEARS